MDEESEAISSIIIGIFPAKFWVYGNSSMRVSTQLGRPFELRPCRLFGNCTTIKRHSPTRLQTCGIGLRSLPQRLLGILALSPRLQSQASTLPEFGSTEESCAWPAALTPARLPRVQPSRLACPTFAVQACLHDHANKGARYYRLSCITLIEAERY